MLYFNDIIIMHKIVAKWDMQEAVRELETELGFLNTLQNI